MPRKKKTGRKKRAASAPSVVAQWQDPKVSGALSSLNYFYRGLKVRGETGGKTKADVKKILENDIYYQSSRGLRKHFQRRRDLTYFIGERYEMDLGDLGNRIQNWKGKVVGRYYLLLIDLFSKKLFARALANKAADTVLAALKSIVADDMKPPYSLEHSVVESDQGLEFVNRGMKAFLAAQKAYHSLSTAANKARYSFVCTMHKIYFSTKLYFAEMWSEPTGRSSAC